jgi:predicted TPR repeat methyltransferase
MTKREDSNPDFQTTDAFAAQYDESARRFGWHSPEILFGLVYEQIQPRDTLLDLGIGTGLSAVPFAKAGLEVSGIDGSREMLGQCAARGVAVDLKQHDIRTTPLPYPDDAFDHVVACGIFHLIERLDDIFREVARLIRGRGTFAFTIEELRSDSGIDDEPDVDGFREIRNEESGVTSFQHSRALVQELLNRNGFTITKTLDYVAFLKTDWAEERTFRAYIGELNERTTAAST